MAISYPLAFPSSPKPRKATITANTKVGISESTFSYSTQKQVHAGQRWEMDLEMPPMTDAEAGQWLAFLLSLNGTQGTALVPEPDRTSLKGVGTGTIYTLANGQTGATFSTKGWAPSVTGIVLAGDLIQLAGHLYMILEDANSNSGTQATLTVWPSLRAPTIINTRIYTTDCKVTMRLTSNQMSWSTNQFKHYGLVLSFVEEV